MHGSFNVCIPVKFIGRPSVLFRVPLPYRVGETNHPGNAYEKIRCELGTYAWLKETCPDVPIPKFMPGYLVIESVSTSSMLSKTRSMILCDDRYVRLANRPLSLGIQELEKEGILVDIPRDFTYTSTYAYLADLLALHVNDYGDFTYETGILAIMHMLSPVFFQREFRRGPFLFSLTDLHQNNIFVDENWRITAFIDLEWGCSLPAEMIRPPLWFEKNDIEALDADKHDSARQEFIIILAADEKIIHRKLSLSSIMEKTWQLGTFWFGLALTTPMGLFDLFDKKIWPTITGEEGIMV
ncbi:hypothetical protein BJX66DRAFT_328625 [Aspergillus keveii]|uniref:Aminoglycoside phosphotransferase domain-containing protein n=1 Tax=Aspergillus keveii TaxID=714993 RepID=A0ABR4FT27_9EURO